MSTLSDFAKVMLGRALCGGAPSLPASVFAALGTGGSDATGITGEPDAGYARQQVSFAGTTVQANADTVQFTFTAGVGVLSHVGLFDAAEGGNPLTWGALSQAVDVNGPGMVTINPGSLTVTAG